MEEAGGGAGCELGATGIRAATILRSNLERYTASKEFGCVAIRLFKDFGGTFSAMNWLSKNPSAFASLIGAVIAASVALRVRNHPISYEQEGPYSFPDA